MSISPPVQVAKVEGSAAFTSDKANLDAAGLGGFGIFWGQWFDGGDGAQGSGAC